MSLRTTRSAPLFLALVLAIVLGPAPMLAQFVGGLNEADEIELGRLTAEELEKDLELLDDELVAAYIRDIGMELARDSGRADIDYHFKVVNTPEINAFALPGGFIYVNRGLIEAADSESELVGVLGHEIGHVVARHGAEQAQRASIANIGFRVLEGVFGGGAGGQVASMAAEMAAAGTFMRFSREAEREADRLGAVNVAAVGFDPRGMITFFEKLGAMRQGEANVVEAFFASHPEPSERVANIQDLLRTLSVSNDPPAPAEGGPRFVEVKERLSALPPAPDGEPEASEAGDGTTDGVAESASSGSEVPPPVVPIPTDYPGMDADHAIAAAHAPVFRQALGETARYDYVTRFDFDGDWVGDNNWDNAADESLALPAVVYYNVAETETHYLIHYSVFHPRDYKGGNVAGAALSELIREGVGRFGDHDPTGMAESAILAHENDMEGALVVAEKTGGGGRVVYVETLAHNQFLQYRPQSPIRRLFGGTSGSSVRLEGSHPVLFIEPKGHGVEAFHGGDQVGDDVRGFVDYGFSGEAGRATATEGQQDVGYELQPMATTLWPRALEGENETYGGAFDYESWTLSIGGEEREFTLGIVGSMFRGGVGGPNMARPPWGWFDMDETDRRQGEWFLTPAETVKRHFNLGDGFSTNYVHHPVFEVYRN